MINYIIFNLMQKFSLVTGAAGLLGIHHAEALIELDLNVILIDINKNKLKRVYNLIKKNYPKANVYMDVMNVCSPKSINTLIKKLEEKKIIVNNLINNAAIDAKVNKKNKMSSFENYNLKDWYSEIEVGLTGTMLCSQIFGQKMVKKKIKGNILNIASDLSVISPNQNIYKIKKNYNYKKPVTYSVIKHGVIGLTKYLSTYWATKGIKVNALSPGSVLHQQPKIILNNLKTLIPMNRLAKKDEYKGAIKFLCSEASDYMTGQNLIIDGGRSVW